MRFIDSQQGLFLFKRCFCLFLPNLPKSLSQADFMLTIQTQKLPRDFQLF